MEANKLKARSPDERAEELLASSAEHDAESRRALLGTALWCVCWSLSGAGMIGLAMHMTDVDRAEIVFAGGLAGGQIAIIVTLIRAWRRHEGS